jgi:hypothetical protein
VLAVGLVVLLVVLLGGEGKFGKVKIGMTEKEVTAAVGDPHIRLADVAIWTEPPIKMEDVLNESKTDKVKTALVVIFENGKVKDREVVKGRELKSDKPPRILKNHPLFK